jgi:para-aminobenzoate synthetase component 1
MVNKVHFLGNEQSDWLNISASNPVDELSLSLKDSPDLLVEFVKNNAGKFIAGFMTYEFGVAQLNVPVHELKGIPAAHFCAFDSYESLNQQTKYSESSWRKFDPVISKNEYESTFKKIKGHIQAGDFYQINYTHPLKSKTDSNPENLFSSLSQKNNVGYRAYFESNEWAIHSLSPEQFIKIENGIISTKPIKGTIQRGNNSIDDEQFLNTLLNSAKEQAELYMIIDLLRNDLGKVCETGTVNVLESKSVQQLEKVYHTYGFIQGTIKQNLHPIEALISMSPGGSISGCPKIRACEIIHDIEPHPRGIYTGSIGYILPNGTLNFNIAIRTIFQQNIELTLGVGGGITVDSNQEDEYEETLTKAASLQP